MFFCNRTIVASKGHLGSLKVWNLLQTFRLGRGSTNCTQNGPLGKWKTKANTCVNSGSSTLRHAHLAKTPPARASRSASFRQAEASWPSRSSWWRSAARWRGRGRPARPFEAYRGVRKGLGPPARCPFSPFLFLVSSPTKIDYRKGYPSSNLSAGGPGRDLGPLGSGFSSGGVFILVVFPPFVFFWLFGFLAFGFLASWLFGFSASWLFGFLLVYAAFGGFLALVAFGGYRFCTQAKLPREEWLNAPAFKHNPARLASVKGLASPCHQRQSDLP